MTEARQGLSRVGFRGSHVYCLITTSEIEIEIGGTRLGSKKARDKLDELKILICGWKGFEGKTCCVSYSRGLRSVAEQSRTKVGETCTLLLTGIQY